jgi:hypothetical protein
MMLRTKYSMVLLALAVAALAAVAVTTSPAVGQPPDARGAAASAPAACPHCGMGMQRGRCPRCTAIDEAAAAIDAARKAVESGDKEMALKQLDAAKARLAACKAPASRPAGAFINRRCPIMTGSAIDPDKVPPELTREFKGQKVAFCCPSCLTAWDKLSDKEKQDKLDAVK